MTIAKWYGRESFDNKVYPLFCGECAVKHGDETLVAIDDVDGAMWLCKECGKTLNEIENI